MESAPRGRIVTFYSYKGGTGRSMALANVAWVLASQGRRVLVVDWDLEAPGLHRYFQPFLVDRDLGASDGVIDFVIDYALETVSEAPGGGEAPADWYRGQADIVRYAASLEWEDWEFPRGGTIDFVGAGRQDSSYSHRVNTFDWSGFYERHGGGAFLEAMRERMREEYDFILIDSRTGVSDTSGVCTVQLPDDLVICFTLNNQSIEGAAAVVSAVQAQRGDDLRIFPVPMRVELAEKDKLEARRAHARTRLGLLPGHLDAARRDAYWSALEVLYVPYYAYEEVLAPFGDRVGTLTSLLGSMERLTAALTDGAVERSEPVPEAMRQEVLAVYARRGGVPEDEPARAAEMAYARLSAEAQATARRAFTRMVRLARPDEGGAVSPARLPTSEVPGARNALAPFMTLGLIASELDPAMSEEVLYWAAPQVIERWPRLHGWIEEERPFLLWRQKLRADLADWEGNQRDPGALLIGAPLAVARDWLAKRGGDLTAAERAYVAESAHRMRSLRLRRMAEVAGVGLILLLSAFGAIKTFSVFNAREAGQKADWYIQSGNQNLQSRNLDGAAADFTQALSVELSDSALLGRATAYLGNGNVRDALQDLEVAVTTFGTAAAYFQRGQVFALQGEAARARADYDEAARLDPRNPDILLARGRLFQSQGDTGAAIADYSQALDLAPDSRDARFQRGTAYQQSGDLASARADFETVLASRGSDALSTAARARLIQMGSTKAAGEQAQEPGVVILYGDPADAAVLTAVEHAMRAQGGFSYVRLERSPGVGPLASLRYDPTTDPSRAVAAKTLVEQTLARQGYPLALNLSNEAVPASSAGPGQIEVSIPSLSQANLLLPSKLSLPPVLESGKGPPDGGP